MTKTAAKASGYARFLQEVTAAQERALVLDYDGTLAPFSAHRLRAVPYPGIPE